MASLESLPPDQRAVLQLVLQRGRSYDEIARLLSIDRSAVRQRATSALNALGPQTGLADERRQVITDYLLGQLEPTASTGAQAEIAAAPGERAWARVVASELAPLANGPLPEIPAAAVASAPGAVPPAAPLAPSPVAAPPALGDAPAPALGAATPPPPVMPPPPGPPAGTEPPGEPAPAKPKRESILLRRARRNQAAAASAGAAASEAAAAPAPPAGPASDTPKPKRESILLRRARRNQASAAAGTGASAAAGGTGVSPEAQGAAGSPPTAAGSADAEPGRSSLFGGMVLIVLTVVIVAAVVVILLNSGGSSPSHAASASSTAAPAASSTAAAPAGSATTTASSSSAAKVIAQINLTPPTATSKAAGIAEVLKEGVNNGIAIVAQNVTPNTTKPPNAYAVWLYNSATDAHILGFVNPGVAANGRLSTAGGLPANAAHYKQLIVTLETKASPTTPGTIILQGKLTLGP